MTTQLLILVFLSSSSSSKRHHHQFTTMAMLVSSSSSSSSSPHSLSFTRSLHNALSPFSITLTLTRSHSPKRAPPSFKATLITNSDSFQVGRAIGSYGFMNVTSYSAFPSALEGNDYSYADFGAGLKTQDVGEGSVKISTIAGSMKVGFPRVHSEVPLLFSRFILESELVELRLI